MFYVYRRCDRAEKRTEQVCYVNAECSKLNQNDCLLKSQKSLHIKVSYKRLWKDNVHNTSLSERNVINGAQIDNTAYSTSETKR